MRGEPLAIGTYVEPYGKVAAVLTTGGERYYMLESDDGVVYLMPADVVESKPTAKAIMGDG